MSNADTVEHLRNLVRALDHAFISSWQSTHAWDKELAAAKEHLKELDEAGPSAPVSPMAKMALALREKSAAERNDFDRRVQSGEWGAMPEPGTEADALPNHVAEVKGDDAIRILRWSNRVGAFDYPVGTKLYATPTQPAAPPAVSQGENRETFEQMFRSIYPKASSAGALELGEDGFYLELETRLALRMWNAALATQPQEAPIDASDRLLADLRLLVKRGVLTEAAFRLIVSWAEQAAPSQDAEYAARYRYLVTKGRLIPEHWGGRWSIVVESRSPKGTEKEHIDAAIDAARAKQESE